MKDRPRAALYARVSTKDKGQDTANQLHQLRDFAQKQDWEIVREYIDHATGKNADRRQFQAMMAAASMREFDLVLFWSLDRFPRDDRQAGADPHLRTHAGRTGGARKQGKRIGRPKVVTDRAKVRELRAQGHSLPAIAREMGLALTTVARICKDAA